MINRSKICQQILFTNEGQEFSQELNCSWLLEDEVKRSAEYLETLKKNSHKVKLTVNKIERLINQNDKLRKQNLLQKENMQIHYCIFKNISEKEIELKYYISKLQDEICILKEKLDQQDNFYRIKVQQYSHLVVSSKEFEKLQQKLNNCILENQLLRQQNKLFKDQQFIKQQSYQFSQKLKSISEEIYLLSKDLESQKQKNNLLEKVIQTKMDYQSALELKLGQSEDKICNLIEELEKQRFSSKVLRQKYDELTQIIQVMDQTRFKIRSKKISLESKTETKCS